jgi:hypothetical protein
VVDDGVDDSPVKEADQSKRFGKSFVVVVLGARSELSTTAKPIPEPILPGCATMSKVSSMGVADASDETRAAHTRSSVAIPKERVNIMGLRHGTLS